MPYINAIKGSSIALVFFSVAAFFIKGHGSSSEVELVLTISTFLFAIITGFFISRLNGRFDRIRELVAEEDAYWISFYYASKTYGNNFLKKVVNIIDEYYIICFDFDLGNYYKHNANLLRILYDELLRVKITTQKAGDLFDDMFVTLGQIEICRNKSSELTREKLTIGQWSVLILLAGIIVFSIFYLQTSVIYSQVIAVVLSTILVMILLIVRDLQNLRLMDDLVTIESGQGVLECLGKMRYYPENYLKKGITEVPEDVKEYRLGQHQPGEKFKIKVVKNKQT